MLGGMERINTSRWVGIVVNLCLRGKMGRVGGRTLMMLRVVSPVVAPTNERLGVAPDNLIVKMRTCYQWLRL